MTVSLRELHDRLEEATAASAAARRRAARAVAVAVEVYARSERVRSDVIEVRSRRRGQRARSLLDGDARSESHWVEGFRIEGVVDDVPAHAVWSDGGLECSPALRQRAEIVVALGETFDPGRGRPALDASLDGPLTAVLPTVMRAFSRVTSVELAVRQTGNQTEAS
jgi:hypothetical protein